jgi:3-isopropylmalate/(R)-2-methylmalate dehydratase large subunit
VNPDQTTYEYIRGRRYAPEKENWERAVSYWESIKSGPDAEYDDEYYLDASTLEPMVTWGINPGQAVGVSQEMPRIASLPSDMQEVARSAYEHMTFREGSPIAGTPINVAFIGSCTNARLSDLKEAARVVNGKKVADGVRAFVVPGSKQVAQQAEAAGLPEVFTKAGFEWRGAGCSMCLAMNPDKLQGREICASSSNRNFIGRQGSPTGRTLLMSPAMVAAAACAGKVVDVRTSEPQPVA